MDSPAPDLPPVGEALLEARGVRVSFRRPGWRGGWFDAVSDAALDIRIGEAVALVGGSGSGKSTLARAIGGLGPMQAGEVQWQGRLLGQRGQIAFADRRGIQLVAQDPVDSLDPRWNAARSVAEGLNPLHPTRETDPAIKELLAEVSLDAEPASHRPAGLSGGQAIGSASCRERECQYEKISVGAGTVKKK